MEQCREAYNTFRILGDAIPSFTSPLETLKAKTLKKELGQYAVGMMAAGHKPTEIADLERPQELADVASSWFTEAVHTMTASAVYEAYAEQQREAISLLLQGKTITAKSLDGTNFSTSDGVMESTLIGGNSLQEHTGPFLAYHPNVGMLYLGTRRNQVIVSLFDLTTHEQTASIEIHDPEQQQ